MALQKGITVREKPVVPFEGVIMGYEIDKELGRTLYLVAQAERDPKTGEPIMVEDQHGDSCDHDKDGKQLFEKDGVTPKNTGKLKNVVKEMVPVIHSRWMTDEEIEVVPEAA